MKLYKPNKAEWITFAVLVFFLVAALNYVFFGSERFLTGDVLLVSYPLLGLLCFLWLAP